MNNTQLVPVYDQQIVSLWLHDRPVHTQKAYKSDIQKLHTFTGKSIRETTLGDLQDFSDSLKSLTNASRARILNAVKSLLSFAHETGYIPLNVGAALKPPPA